MFHHGVLKPDIFIGIAYFNYNNIYTECFNKVFMTLETVLKFIMSPEVLSRGIQVYSHHTSNLFKVIYLLKILNIPSFFIQYTQLNVLITLTKKILY